MTCQLHKHDFQVPGKALSYTNTHQVSAKQKSHGESPPLEKRKKRQQNWMQLDICFFTA